MNKLIYLKTIILAINMKWDELTSYDVANLDKDKTVVILPVGSVEVHGNHLPLGTDSMVIYYVALEAARNDGNSIVLPPLYYAYVPENRHFPGTISLNSETFLKVLEDIINEIERQGFKRLLILNGHGGNNRPLRLLLRKILESKKKIKIYAVIDPYAPMEEMINKVRETKVIGHACEIETSLVLYVNSKLVRLERVKGEAKLGKLRVNEFVETPIDWQRYAIMGYVGDPRKASKEKGKVLLDFWIKKVVDIIRDIRNDKEYEKTLEEYYGKAYK